MAVSLCLRSFSSLYACVLIASLSRDTNHIRLESIPKISLYLNATTVGGTGEFYRKFEWFKLQLFRIVCIVLYITTSRGR